MKYIDIFLKFQWNESKELQNNNLNTYFIAYKIKTNYFMTKQIVWPFRKFFFVQFDTKFASKQQRLAKIDTILWLLLSTQISQVWHTTQQDTREKRPLLPSTHTP